MKKKYYHIYLPLIIITGAMLRFWGAATKSFRFEEHVLWDLTAPGSWRGFFRSFNELAGYGWNPLNPFICRFFREIGEGEAILRLPAAIWGIFSIYALYRLGKSIFNDQTGIIAAILLAFSPMAIAWSQDARYFSLASFLCILSAFFLTEALYEKKRAWTGFVLTNTALLLSTYQGGTIIAMEGLFLCLPVIICRLRRRDDQRSPVKPFIYFLVSGFISFILISLWLYYDIEKDFRVGKVVVDTLADVGNYKTFLDWGGGNILGFLFCLFLFLLGMLGTELVSEPIAGDETEKKVPGIGKRVAILPAALSGVPLALALAGIYRGDQIFFGLPFFLLIVAKGMAQVPAIIYDKTKNRRFILTSILGAYLLLQIIPVYNLETNRKLSFIPKPDWKKAAAYFYPLVIKRKQTILLENKHDFEIFRRYITTALKERNKITDDLPIPALFYLEKDILQTLAQDEYREGSIIQSPNRGKLSDLMANPLFRSYFTQTASFAGLKIYRYRLPILVMEDNHTRHDIQYNDLRITRSEDLHKQLLFLEAGDYLAAFQTEGDIPVQFSVSIDGGEEVVVSSDSVGLGSFKIPAGQGLKELVFRLRKPDALQLKWLSVHRILSDRIAFQAEDFQYTIPEKTNWIRKHQIEDRKTAGLFINGSIGYYFALAEGGEFRLELEAYDTRFGPIDIAVDLDGKRVGVYSFDKLNGRWDSRYMSLKITSGIHRIAFSFINDLKIKGRDRNAFLDRFELNRISGLPAGE